MIAPMRKYSFLLYHLDYENFLSDLQKLGVVHIIRNKVVETESLKSSLALIENYSEAIRFLGKHLKEDSQAQDTQLVAKMLLRQLATARERKEQLTHERDIILRQLHDLRPWGNFNTGLVPELEKAGINVRFYTCPKVIYKPEWEEHYLIESIHEEYGKLFFIELDDGNGDKHPTRPVIEADLFTFPKQSLAEYERELKSKTEELEGIEVYFTGIAKTATQLFEDEIHKLTTDYEFEDALQQADTEAEDHIRILSGWIPLEKEEGLTRYLTEHDIIHFKANPGIEDEVPILLKNNAYARFFEPISRMFMLPKYNDLDLTPFFAPFFMLFFGFCNADIGYGIALVILALFLKKKSKDQGMKNMMTLVMIFGIAASFMGWVMGSLLAFDMKEWAGIGDTVPIREMNHIFNLALVLGVLQILFGILLSTIKQIRQSGLVHGIAPFGIFLFLLSAVILGSPQLGANPGVLADYAIYTMYAGLVMIFFFNSPGKNVIINILSGIWKMYNVVTGFFGDLLSYIRLFALSVSSSILGLVVNSMGVGMLKIPYVGWLIFFVFMVFGHSLNLALGALGGFVHPLRLTFVEFYKNAEFTGPGPEYKPFGRKNTVK
ncbi:MAG: V-type ATPase 116kDa subunit family protein [Candidatus Cloacimonetes bacterium]|nr:V-type ATPase 116kDa subunit family protein [Candidatus Cloacimonadota bacterium]